MLEHTELDDFQTNNGANLVWRNVNIYTKDKSCGRNGNQLKCIINNASGTIEGGTLMAVMGSRLVRIC